MKFTVALEKQYYNSETDDTREVCGEIEIEAESQEAADAIVSDMLAENRLGGGPCFQSSDPRIEWEEDFEDLDEEGYEYVDWSFGLVGLD